MKTTISIPDDLFDELEGCRRRMKMSRRRLFTDAVREYIARRRRPVDATKAWNDAISAGGDSGNEAGAVALRRRSKAVVRAELRKGTRWV
jgi:metal-responsive CopG/Arc/MetJ family transcriptional regulator